MDYYNKHLFPRESRSTSYVPGTEYSRLELNLSTQFQTIFINNVSQSMRCVKLTINATTSLQNDFNFAVCETSRKSKYSLASVRVFWFTVLEICLLLQTNKSTVAKMFGCTAKPKSPIHVLCHSDYGAKYWLRKRAAGWVWPVPRGKASGVLYETETCYRNINCINLYNNRFLKTKGALEHGGHFEFENWIIRLNSIFVKKVNDLSDVIVTANLGCCSSMSIQRTTHAFHAGRPSNVLWKCISPSVTCHQPKF